MGGGLAWSINIVPVSEVLGMPTIKRITSLLLHWVDVFVTGIIVLLLSNVDQVSP